MNHITFIFSEIANETKPVSYLINILTNKKDIYTISQEEKFAYQAFCCALLAKEEKKWMQKGQYIKEYDLFIQKSLCINPECTVTRLIRLMVEKKLENVSFVNHIEADTLFLTEKRDSIDDINIKELIDKIILR